MAAFSSNIDITSGGTYAMDVTNGETSSKVATDLNGKFANIQELLQNGLPEVWTGDSLPDSLPNGKIITWNNGLYCGGADVVQANGLPVNDVRQLQIADTYSVSAGQVVDIDENNQVVTDVVPQDNVENVFRYSAIAGIKVRTIAGHPAVCWTRSDTIHAGVTLMDNEGKSLSTFDKSGSGSKGHPCDILTTEGEYAAVIIGNPSYRYYYLVSVTENSISSVSNISNLFPFTPSDNVPLNETTNLSFYDNNGLTAQIVTITSSSVTVGDSFKLSNNTGASYISVCRLPDEGSNKRVCICFSDTGDGGKGKAVIATIDSNNAVTFGGVVTVTDTTTSGTACASDSNCIVATFSLETTVLNFDLSVKIPGSALSVTKIVTVKDGLFVGYNSGGTDVARVLLVSDTISSGDLYYYNSDSNVSYVSGTAVSDNKILLAYADDGNSSYGTTTILEVLGNQIAGSFIESSKDAIALASGNGGDVIPVGFGGYCQCDGVTEGQQITSAGVSAFSPLDGWLMISYAQEKLYVVGKYVGTGTYGSANQTVIDAGFTPSKVELYSISSTKIITAKVIFINYITSGQIQPLDSTSSQGWINFTFTNTGIKYYGGSANYQCNSKATTYYYIAWR